MRFAFLVPSRQRPGGLERFIESVINTVSGKHEIIITVGLDNDDPRFSDYDIARYCEYALPLNIKVEFVIGKRQLLAVTWNDLAKATNADYYVCGNDDEVFITVDWDEIFYRKTLGRNPYHMYFFDDGLQHGNHAAFPIVSKEWIEAVGYYFPEIFIHNYVDTWVNDIAVKLGQRVYIPEVKHQHLHYSLGLSKFDQTYEDGMKDNSNNRDKKVFEATEPERNRIAEILKQKICQTI